MRMTRFLLFVTLFVGGLLFARPAEAADLGAPERLEMKGLPDAFYYKPIERGLKPVFMFLHGRGGNPAEDCKKWAKTARDLGWVVCPQGIEDKGGGARAWANDPASAKQIVDATLSALREKFKRRVQLKGNILIGFSEGAFVAMQIGIQEPDTWNRWLILGASDGYIFGGKDELHEKAHSLHRVYLLTGENDMVAKETERAGEILKGAKIPTKVKIEPGLGHEVPADKMIANYKKPLRWLLAEGKYKEPKETTKQ